MTRLKLIIFILILFSSCVDNNLNSIEDSVKLKNPDPLLVPYVSMNDEKYGYADTSLQIVIPIQFDIAEPFVGHYANVGFRDSLGNEKMGVINKKGNWIIPAIYEEVKDASSEGIFIVQRDDTCWYLNKKGEIIFNQYFFKTRDFEENISIAKDSLYRSVMINTEDMTLITLPQYQFIFYAGEGMWAAGVYTGTQTGKYGFINEEGKEIIPIQFSDHAHSIIGKFTNGFAMAYDENWNIFYVSKTSQKIIKPDSSVNLLPNYSEGMVLAEQNNKFGYYDTSGILLIPFEYDQADEFSEGLAYVEKNGKYGYIDRSGKEVIPITRDIDPDHRGYNMHFSNGLSLFHESKFACGYLNEKGDKAFSSLFYDARPFINGFAVVNGHGNQNFINTKGEKILKQPVYIIYDPAFENDFTQVEITSGIRGYIDKWGHCYWK